MFVKLEKRVITTIFAATAVFVAAVSLIIAVVVSRSYLKTFEDGVAEAARIAVEYSAIKLDTIKSDAIKIAADEGIAAGLGAATYATAINPKLNYFRSQYQEEIVGLTLYASNGFVYKTDSLPIASIQPFATLSAKPAIAAFLAADASELVTIVGAETPAPVVRSFTIVVKIPGPAAPLGYLFVDIDPDFLFHAYFAFGGHPGFVPIANYVYADGAVRHPSVNRVEPDWIGLSEPGFAAGNRIYLARTPLYGADDELLTVVSPAPLYEAVLDLFAYLAAIDAAILAVAYLAARRHAAFLVAKLELLRDKMSRTRARIE